MNKKISVLLVLVLLVVSPPAQQIVKAASGLCEIYWLTATWEGGYGVGPGGSSTIQAALQGMGYTANRYQNTEAYYVRRTMNSDIVFAIVSHGSPGRVYCNNGTTMSANAVSSDNANYSLAAFFGSGSFSSMKFAYYGGCETARTDSTYGNLLTYTTSTLKAKSALGFYNSVYDAQATFFERQLFYNLGAGSSVATAASFASASTFSEFGDYGEVNTYTISGAGSTIIR